MNELHKSGALIAIIIIFIIALIGYTYILETSNQNPDQSTPTPTPTPSPTGNGANLIVNIQELGFGTDGGLRLLITGNITNSGTQTAYNVGLHIQTWFSDGSKGLDKNVTLNKQLIWILPPESVNIAMGETYTLTSRWFPERLNLSVPGEFWLDEWGEVYPYDLISTYLITPFWDDIP